MKVDKDWQRRPDRSSASATEPSSPCSAALRRLLLAALGTSHAALRCAGQAGRTGFWCGILSPVRRSHRQRLRPPGRHLGRAANRHETVTNRSLEPRTRKECCGSVSLATIARNLPEFGTVLEAVKEDPMSDFVLEIFGRR